jgi:hypothetical protein
MQYKYTVSRIINAKTFDDAVDILQLTLEDITLECKVEVFNNESIVSTNSKVKSKLIKFTDIKKNKNFSFLPNDYLD